MNAMHPLPHPCRPSSSRPARAGGFTLIELMVVLTVIGVLSAIAYPSYAEYLLRGHRAEAKGQLLEAAQFMQRFYAVHDRYDRQRDGAAVALPAGLQQAPARGSARYNIVVSTVSMTTYTLEARPVGSFSGDPCGVLVLNGLGQRDVRAGTRASAECWK